MDDLAIDAILTAPATVPGANYFSIMRKKMIV